MATDKLSYVLAAISESQAMAVRMNEEWRNQPGYAAYFIQRVGQQVAIRMPTAAAKNIPEINNSHSRLLRNNVLAWSNLGLRLYPMQAPIVVNRIDWLVFLAGLGLAAVTSWLRTLALELEADGQWPMPSDVDLASEWGIEDAILSQGINSAAEFIESFKNETSSLKKNILDEITPLGWLFLVAGRMGLIGKDANAPLDYELLKTLHGADGDPIKAMQELRDKTKQLAHRLAPPITEKTDSEQWPFEYITESLNTYTIWNETFVKEAFELLDNLDRLCAFQIILVSNAPWRLEPREQKFTDGEGIIWKLQPWQIALSGGSKPVVFEHEGRYHSQWTETRNKDGRLLGVSAIGEQFGKFVLEQLTVAKKPPETPAKSIQDATLVCVGAESTSHPEADFPPFNELDDKNPSIDISVDAKKLRKKWLEHQNSAWSSRQHRVESHVRLAFLQWKVDDSYRHPLFELAMPGDLETAWYGKAEAERRKKERSIILNCAKDRLKDKQSSSNDGDCVYKDKLAQAVAEADQGGCWTYSAILPSWAEHRRRKLLAEALRACDQFGVDVLVLPEYSVRPDTIKWLKEKLEQTSSQVTILAGTYRLYGRSHDTGFEACYSEILGVVDFEKIFPDDRTRPTNLISSGERSSILSLLLPIKQNERPLVSAFTRRKKYPAMAANEIFNPGIDPWKPLFTLDTLLHDLQRRDLNTGKRLTVPTNDISVNAFLELLPQVKCERYLAELICSELFVVTNPSNWNNIASEYYKLLKRFGSQDTIHNAKGKILDDLWEFACYLGISGRPPMEDNRRRSSSGADIPQRSIILLPAMTTRSADYWIFGQSALLAAGITTVFCNAVEKDYSIGGSCVIGRESWKDGKSIAGISPLITPYNGWSRGIYYNDKKDALGEKEQAMVIVDIDPVHMMEGKPRPQALPVPLQLVAHLPLVETIDWSKRIYKSRQEDEQKDDAKKPHIFDTSELTELLKQFDDFKQDKSQAWNPNENEPKTLYRWTTKNLVPIFSEKDGNKAAFEERLKKWKEDWRELPFAGYPPAIMDWLWVDFTPPADEEVLPKIFVPPWGSDG